MNKTAEIAAPPQSRLAHILAQFLTGELAQDEFVAQALSFPAHAITAALRQIAPKGLKGETLKRFQAQHKIVLALVQNWEKTKRSHEARFPADDTAGEAASETEEPTIVVTNPEFFGDPNLAQNANAEDMAKYAELRRLIRSEVSTDNLRRILESLEMLHVNHRKISRMLATDRNYLPPNHKLVKGFHLHWSSSRAHYHSKPGIMLDQLYNSAKLAASRSLLRHFLGHFLSEGCMEKATLGAINWAGMLASRIETERVQAATDAAQEEVGQFG